MQIENSGQVLLELIMAIADLSLFFVMPSASRSLISFYLESKFFSRIGQSNYKMKQNM